MKSPVTSQSQSDKIILFVPVTDRLNPITVTIDKILDIYVFKCNM